MKKTIFVILGLVSVVLALFYGINAYIDKSIDVGVKGAILAEQNKAIRQNALDAEVISRYNERESNIIEQEVRRKYYADLDSTNNPYISTTNTQGSERPECEIRLQEVANALQVFFVSTSP